MQGVHRLGRTDRSLLWGTAALIAFTLGAVAVARTNGGTVLGTRDSRLCYNSAGVGAACLPAPPADLDDVLVPSGVISATPAPASPAGSEAAPSATPPVVPTPAPAPTSKAPATKPSASKNAVVIGTPAWSVGVAYREGAEVTYDGRRYACLQPHTSQVDWSPVAAPALWSRVS